MPLVIDASIALTWCFLDEGSRQTEGVLDLLKRDGAVVPALWHLELANILSRAERLGRIDEAGVDRFLSRTDGLNIATDSQTTSVQRGAVLKLVRQFGLTAYGATYLDLAQRLGATLATLDVELRAAAEASGVTCLP